MDMALSRQEFGRRMRAARERAHLTQQEVADQMGVAWRQAQKWDSGKVLPRPSRIPEIAEVLGVDPSYLQDPIDEHTVDRTARIVQENAVALRTTLSLLDELLAEVRGHRGLSLLEELLVEVRANRAAVREATAEVNGRLEALEARTDAAEVAFSAAQREVLRLAGVEIPPPAEAAPGSAQTRESR